MTALAGWQNFYVIVGSSAGALIGLQFVVLSLIADRPMVRSDAEAGGAFARRRSFISEPCSGSQGFLALHGTGSAPLQVFGGVVYAVIVTRRMRAQTAYRPEFEDWLFHVLLPFAAYLILAISACAARFRPREALFGAGAAALLLLFIGIHNAWDAVTYHVFVGKQEQRGGQRHR